MGILEDLVAHISDFLMTYIVSTLLVITGITYTVRLNFFQFRFFPHVIKNTIGTIFDKNRKKGTITPFQAFASSLGTTAGATNIVGVAVAISLGGAGGALLDVDGIADWNGDKICRNCTWSKVP